MVSARGRPTDLQLIHACFSLIDVHANGRPPLARLRYLLKIKNNLFVGIRRVLYAPINAPAMLASCPIVHLSALTSPMEFVPMAAIASNVINLQHLCRIDGLAEPVFFPTALGVVCGQCTPCEDTAAGAAPAPAGEQGRHRSVTHAVENPLWFVNELIRDQPY